MFTELRAKVEALNAKALAEVEPVRLFSCNARDQLDLITTKRTPLVFESRD